MEGTARFESEVLSLLRQLDAKKERIRATYTSQLADIDKQIEAVQTTAQLMREGADGAHEAIATRPSISVPGNLRGKTIREACVDIASHNGGRLKVSDAARALVLAGVITSKKHAWGQVYTTCSRSKEFEKDSQEPGTFFLILESNQQKLPAA